MTVHSAQRPEPNTFFRGHASTSSVLHLFNRLLIISFKFICYYVCFICVFIVLSIGDETCILKYNTINYWQGFVCLFVIMGVVVVFSASIKFLNTKGKLKFKSTGEIRMNTKTSVIVYNRTNPPQNVRENNITILSYKPVVNRC